MTVSGADASLERQLAYLATALLGWAEDYYAGMKMWNDGGKLYYHAEESRGPLSLYARLLSGDGMLEIMEAMRALGFDCHVDVQGYSFATPGVWVEFTDMALSVTSRQETDADRLTECVARAAYEALTTRNT